MCSGVWTAAAAAGGSERADLAGGRRAARRRPRASPSPPRLPAQRRTSPLVPARFSAVTFLVASHCGMGAAMFRDAVCGSYQILASALTVERHYDDRIKRLLVCHGVLSVSNMGIRTQSSGVATTSLLAHCTSGTVAPGCRHWHCCSLHCSNIKCTLLYDSCQSSDKYQRLVSAYQKLMSDNISFVRGNISG